MQRIEPGHSDQSRPVRRWRVALRSFPENQPEVRPVGREILLPPKGNVDLQCVSQQEDTEQRRAVQDIDVGDRIMIVIQTASPCGDDLLVRSAGLQAQSQVYVRPAVELSGRSRPGMRRAT